VPLTGANRCGCTPSSRVYGSSEALAKLGDQPQVQSGPTLPTKEQATSKSSYILFVLLLGRLLVQFLDDASKGLQ